jgi:hypothetical protein
MGASEPAFDKMVNGFLLSVCLKELLAALLMGWKDRGNFLGNVYSLFMIQFHIHHVHNDDDDGCVAFRVAEL